MAQSPNSAYMLWRQFSGDAKPTGQTGLGSLRTAQVQGEQRVGPSNSQAVEGFVKAASGFWGEVQKAQEQKKVDAGKQVDAWMAQHTMAEYRQKMQEGNVPFQNDPVSMDVLHNKAAYNLALEVEEKIQANTKGGLYKTVEEAEKARTEALNGARSEYALSLGISPDDKAFATGFDRDSERRRQMLVGLQTDVTDKALRTQAKLGARAELISTLVPEFVQATGGNPALNQFVGKYITRQRELGIVRSDADELELYGSVISHFEGMAGGSAAIKELGNAEVSIGGKKATLRDLLGGATFDQSVLKAADAENQRDAARQGELHGKLYTLSSKNDLGGLIALRDTRAAEAGGQVTREVQTIQQTINHVQQSMDRQNAIAAQQVQKQREKDFQISQGMASLGAYLNGDVTAMSAEARDLGLTQEEASQAEQRLLGGIPDGPERWKAMVKLAALRQNGYSNTVIENQNRQANESWNQYRLALQRGESPAVPQAVASMADLYQTDPVAFTGAIKGDPKYLAAIDVSQTLGMSLEAVAKSEVAWEKVPKDTKKALETELGQMGAKIAPAETAYSSGVLKTLAGTFLSMGLSPGDAMDRAKETFKKQHTVIEKTPIHSSFFAFTGDKQSAPVGVSIFEGIVKEQREALKAPDALLGLRYDRTGQRVTFVNIQTGEQSQAVDRETIKGRAVKQAEAEKAKTAARIEKVIKEEQAGNKARKAVTEEDVQRAANPLFAQ